LFYYRARWYDPTIGKFISEDPIGFAAGDANVSRYVGNRVSNNTDPTGLRDFDPATGAVYNDDGTLYVEPHVTDDATDPALFAGLDVDDFHHFFHVMIEGVYVASFELNVPNTRCGSAKWFWMRGVCFEVVAGCSV
jgi:hypothetical protein